MVRKVASKCFRNLEDTKVALMCTYKLSIHESSTIGGKKESDQTIDLLADQHHNPRYINKKSFGADN